MKPRGVWGRRHVCKKGELNSRFVRVLVLKWEKEKKRINFEGRSKYVMEIRQWKE